MEYLLEYLLDYLLKYLLESSKYLKLHLLEQKVLSWVSGRMLLEYLLKYLLQ